MKPLQCKKDFESNRLLFVGRPASGPEAAAQKPSDKKAPEALDPKVAREVAKRYIDMIDQQFNGVEDAFGEDVLDSRTNKLARKPYKLDRKLFADPKVAPKTLTAKYPKIPGRVLMTLAEMAQIQASLRKASWKVSGETISGAGQRLDELNVQLYRGSEELVKGGGGDPLNPTLGFGVHRETGTHRVSEAYRGEKIRVASAIERKTGGESKETPAGIAEYAADLNEANKQYEALSKYSVEQLVEKGIIILPEGVDPKSAQARKLVAERRNELKGEIADYEVSLKRLAHNLDRGKYGVEGNVAIQRSIDGQKYMIIVAKEGKYNRREITYIGTNVKPDDFNLSTYDLYDRVQAWEKKKRT